MDSSLPISIGITNAHWANLLIAHLAWLHKNNIIGDSAYNAGKEKLKELGDSTPEPSFDNFRLRALNFLPKASTQEILGIPLKYAFYTANTMLIRDNNEVMFAKYSEYKNNLKDIASGNLELFQILDKKVTTVGYEFALFYNSFRKILEKLNSCRKYAEFINRDVFLDSYLESYDPDKLDFIAEKLQLSGVTSFTSANLNWFISTMREIGIFVKGVIEYVKGMADKKLLEVDTSLFAEAIDWADRLLADDIPVFEVNFSLYSRLFSYMNNAIIDMHKVITTMKFNFDAFEKASESIEKTKYLPVVVALATTIFNS